jgi:hypothetical protein
MKRFVAAVASMGILILTLAGCDIFKGANKIAYPMTFWISEAIGDPISFEIRFEFSDQTPDTSGISYSSEIKGDSIKILIEGTSEGTEGEGYFANDLLFDFGQIPAGSYVLHIESNNSKADNFELTVADSIYTIKEANIGKVALSYTSDTLRRFFADMVLVEMGGDTSLIKRMSDTLNNVFTAFSGTKLSPRPGNYSFFEVNAAGRILGNREQSDSWQIYSGFDSTACLLFKYPGDTVALSAIYGFYGDSIPGFSIRTGAGFDRCNYEY